MTEVTGRMVVQNGEEYELPPGIGPDQLWIKNVRAGYDPAWGRWRDKTGRYTSLIVLQEDRLTPDQRFGGIVESPILPTPWSDAWSQFEGALGGITTGEILDISKGIRESADPMPRAIKEEMKRSAHFFWQEGDIAQTFIIPMELTLQNIYVESDDSGIASMMNELYGPDIGIDLRWHLYEIHLCAAIYGQAFPVELWEEEKGHPPIPSNIIPLHPLDVDCGQRMSRENFDIRLPAPGGKWTEEHKRQLRPIEVALQERWSESFNKHEPLSINPEYCRPVRWHSLNFDRYAHPPIASMFRPITTRILVEEGRRAVVEGYRQQMWLVQVGTPENRGTSAEIQHMRAQLDALRGQRVPTILWNGAASISCITPANLEAMMNDVLWLSITLDIMRRRGIALSVISGESPSRAGAGRGDVDIDIRMLLMRLAWARMWLLRWEAGLKRKIIYHDTADNFWARRAAEKAKVRTIIEPTPEDMSHRIEEHLRPLVGIGQVSSHTILQAAGLDYETELQHKLDEAEHSYLFTPPVTFKQAAILPSGEETETVSPERQQPETERNRLKQQINAVVLGQEEDKKDKRARTLYREWLAMVWALAVLEAGEAQKQLANIVQDHMFEAARLGYERLGGKGVLDYDWVKRGVSFILGYAPGLEYEWAMLSGPRKRWRLGLYAQEGMRVGYVMGMQQAAWQVHEATHWQRILHPERSTTGPCVYCQEDSFHLHPITEPFFEYHPQGVCTAQALAFYRTDTGKGAFLEVDIPVPGDVWAD